MRQLYWLELCAIFRGEPLKSRIDDTVLVPERCSRTRRRSTESAVYSAKT